MAPRSCSSEASAVRAWRTSTPKPFKAARTIIWMTSEKGFSRTTITCMTGATARAARSAFCSA
jgi:hypothetical protein